MKRTVRPVEEEEEEEEQVMPKVVRRETARAEQEESELDPPIVHVTIPDRADPGAVKPTFERLPDSAPALTVLDASDMFSHIPAEARAEALAEAIVRAEIAQEEKMSNCKCVEADEEFVAAMTREIAKAWLDEGFATGRRDIHTRRRELHANVAAYGGPHTYRVTDDQLMYAR